MKHQVQKTYKAKQKYQQNDYFKLYPNDIQNLYLTLEIHKSQIQELQQWCKNYKFKHYFRGEVWQWATNEKNKDKLQQSAKKSIIIIEGLLKQRIPHMIVEIYMQTLQKLKKKIYIPEKAVGACQLYNKISSSLIIDYLSLFHIDLPQKQKQNLIYEIIHKVIYNKSQPLVRLLKLFKLQHKYVQIAIKQLIKIKKHSVAGSLIKKLKIPKQQYPQLQIKLLQSSAIGMPNWQRQKFSFQMLQQVYCEYPSALGKSFNALFRKKMNKNELQHIASVIKRNPKINDFLTKQNKDKLKDKFNNIPNFLRTNIFGPSNKQKYFSLEQFGFNQKNTIWVDQINIEQCLNVLGSSKIIGIDTESRVARTALNTQYELLATIQISNQDTVFVIDAYALKKLKIKNSKMAQFFNNPQCTVIGHTLQADLNGTVTSLLGFQGKIKCKAIDIFPIFKNIYPDNRGGLAYISEKILGKQICKQYTLTNWQRRPLLKNQLHYAALDAVVVIKIWQQMVKLKQYKNAQQRYLQKLNENSNKINKKQQQQVNEENEEIEQNRQNEQNEKQLIQFQEQTAQTG